QKRHTLSEIERRYGFMVSIEADSDLHAADCEIERLRGRRDDRDRPTQETARASYDEVAAEEHAGVEANGFDTAEAPPGERDGEEGDGGDGGRRRRRRRRRRGRRDGEADGTERPQAMGEEDRSPDESEPEGASEAEAHDPEAHEPEVHEPEVHEPEEREPE